MYYICSFTVLVLFLTLYDDLWLVLYLSVILCTIHCIAIYVISRRQSLSITRSRQGRQRIDRHMSRIDYKRYVVAFGVHVLLYFIACVSVFWKQYTYVWWDFFSWSVYWESRYVFVNNMYRVLENDKAQRYVIQDHEGISYFLYSKAYVPLGSYVYIADTYIAPRIHTSSDRETFLPLQRLQSTTATQDDSDVASWLYQFNFSKWMLMKGIRGSFYDPDMTIIRNHTNTESDISFLSKMQSALFALKLHIRTLVVDMYWQTDIAWLYNGLLVWDIWLLSETSRSLFVDANLIHIVAVSGWNIVMLVVFCNAVLFWIPKKIRICVLACLVICYGLICGGWSSVLRAMIMWCLWLIAMLFGRQVSIYRLLWYTRCAMLLYNPYVLLYDIWFLLSFAAIVGIVAFQYFFWYKSVTTTTNKSTPAFWLKYGIVFYESYVLPTLWASVWVLPLLLFFIGTTNIW